MPEPEIKGDRIAKLLARAGIASRREVERMIGEGRIKLGDDVITTPATILTTLKGITVDGKPVKAPEAPRLFGFHKPDGLITAERDPAGRPTIYSALRNALPLDTPRIMPVGRLDFNTEGLLLLTNDGELKRAMELPSSGIPRTYRARTFGDITQGQLEELIEGITIEDMRYGSINANMERSTGRNQWIEMTMTEGKNREVRRVLEHLGLQVSRLIRVAYGPFLLGDLQRGSAVEIAQKDVERFRKSLLTGRPVTTSAKDPEARPVRPNASPRSAAPRSEPERPRRSEAPRGRSDHTPRERSEEAPRGRFRSGGERTPGNPASRDAKPEGRAPKPFGAKPAESRRDGGKPAGATHSGWNSGESRELFTRRPSAKGARPEGGEPRRGGPKGSAPEGAAPRSPSPRGSGPKGSGPKGSGPKGTGPRGGPPKGRR